MTQLQKIIKYGAMAFAVFLAVAIIGGIVSAVVGLSFAVDVFTSVTHKEEISATKILTDFDENQITALEIDLATAALRIETGKDLQVSQNKAHVRVEEKGNTIVIEEEDHPFWDESGTVTLTVPQDFSFLTTEIEAGAGKIKVEVLKTADLTLSLGAGEAVFEQLSVSGRAEVETGAGKLIVKNGAIGKLDTELGVGKAEISAAIGNGSRVECGVGALQLTLLGGVGDYTVHAQTGFGSFAIDGQTVTENTTIGNGVNTVTVEGGVGTVDVTFA